jgi:hypothetical protein
MSTQTPFQTAVDSVSPVVVGGLLTLVALVTLGYGATVLSQASGSPSATTYALALLAFVVSFGAVAGVVSLFMRGVQRT